MVCSVCKNHSDILVQQSASSHNKASASCPSSLLASNNDFFRRYIQKEIEPIVQKTKEASTLVSKTITNTVSKNDCLQSYTIFLYDETRKDWAKRRKRVLTNGILLYKIPLCDSASFIELENKKIKNVKIQEFVSYVSKKIGENQITVENSKLMKGSFIAGEKVHVKISHKQKAALKILKSRSNFGENHGCDWCFSADRDRPIIKQLTVLKENNKIQSYFWTIESASLVLVNEGMPGKNSAASKETKREYSCTVHNPNVDLFINKATFAKIKSLERYENFVDLNGDIAKK